MRLHTFLKQPAGALIALTVVTLGSVGAYAAVNWFDGHVGVKTDGSVITIDLSSCKNAFLPGFSDTQDMKHVQFKVVGQPHISEPDLKQTLLTQCENDAVLDFYHSNPTTKDVDLHSSKVIAVSSDSLTLSYTWGGETINKNFALTNGITFYNQGAPITVADIKVGQSVMFATPHREGYIMEGVDPLQNVTSLVSVFVTQYDTTKAPSNGKHNFSYADNNIMPLGMYNELYKK